MLVKERAQESTVCAKGCTAQENEPERSESITTVGVVDIIVPQSGGSPQGEGSNGRLGHSRDTRYGTRGPGSRADRNAKT